MTEKLHIVRLVADTARHLYFCRQRDRHTVPRPRVNGQEIGVEFEDGDFIPYADLGYSQDVGFFRLSETDGVVNEAAPFAAAGKLIDLGQVVVTTGAARRLSNEEIADLLQRHASGDYGELGEFFLLDVDDRMLIDEEARMPRTGAASKVSTLTGMDAVVSAYAVREHRIWVITEAGESRTTLLLFAGAARA